MLPGSPPQSRGAAAFQWQKAGTDRSRCRQQELLLRCGLVLGRDADDAARDGHAGRDHQVEAWPCLCGQMTPTSLQRGLRSLPSGRDSTRKARCDGLDMMLSFRLRAPTAGTRKARQPALKRAVIVFLGADRRGSQNSVIDRKRRRLQCFATRPSG